MKRFSVLILAVWGGASYLSGATPSDLILTNTIQITPDYINQLAEAARTNNPGLQAAEALTRAAEANVHSIRIWEDPQIFGGKAFGERSMLREEGDLAYGIEQDLPLFGKPQAARQVALAQAETAETNAEFRFQMLRLELARQLLETALADKRSEIRAQDLAWLQAAELGAEERYRAGAGRQTEVIQLHHARQIVELELETLRQVAAQERVALNRLLGRPLETPWPILLLPDLAPPIEFTPQLRNITLRHEARLKVLRREIREAEAELELARRLRRPNVALSLEARQYSGTGEFQEGMVGIKFNLPWFNRAKYRNDIEREKAELEAAQMELADYELYVPTEARRLIVLIDAARRKAFLYLDQIIPKSELALASAEAAWTGSRGSFSEMMELRRMVLEDRLAYAEALAAQYKLLAELALCCGVADLEALEMFAAPEKSSDSPSRTRP